MSENVVALPGFSIPSHEPVETVVEILMEALRLAEQGEIVGIAVVCAYRQPRAFGNRYHAEQSGLHSLAAGVLALGYQVGKELLE